MIESHLDGIEAYCHEENKGLPGFVEGLDNEIRMIQRRAYGFRDEEYSRRKILTCMAAKTQNSPTKKPEEPVFPDLSTAARMRKKNLMQDSSPQSPTNFTECAAGSQKNELEGQKTGPRHGLFAHRNRFSSLPSQ